MKTKKGIIDNWLPRYTATPTEIFGDFFLLTNLGNHLESYLGAK